MVAAPDNRLSLQGLSDKEIVIALPGMEGYTAVVIRDTAFVKVVRTWFKGRVASYTRKRLFRRGDVCII